MVWLSLGTAPDFARLAICFFLAFGFTGGAARGTERPTDTWRLLESHSARGFVALAAKFIAFC
jgi:hypothetical protein